MLLMARYPDNYFGCIVDPPYGMGKPVKEKTQPSDQIGAN
jgi:hypothetical protein